MKRVDVTVWIICLTILYLSFNFAFRTTPFLEICNCVNDRCKVSRLYSTSLKQFKFSQSSFREFSQNVKDYIYYDDSYIAGKNYKARYFVFPFDSAYALKWKAKVAVKKIKQNKDICVVKVAGNFTILLFFTILIIVLCIDDIRWQMGVLAIINPIKKRRKNK